jgi:polysaccharide export outer membrane protein
MDTVEITVLEQPQLSKRVTIPPDGVISLPLVGRVRAWGLTPLQLEEKIKAVLSAHYLVDPDVTVSVVSYGSRRFFVFGKVRRVGSYPMEQQTTILKAITIAGGFTEDADPRRVKVLRRQRNGYKIIMVNVKEIVEGRMEDILLCSEDIVIVPESFF